METLVLGNGQVARTFYSLYPSSTLPLISKATLDLTDHDATERLIKSCRPSIVINAAAYTDVDSAENAIDSSEKINYLMPQYLAELSNKYNFFLIHLSTDYVFQSIKNLPIKTNDVANPINQYGLSKLKGELSVKDISNNFCNIRISRVFSKFGTNFVDTIKDLIVNKKKVDVVNDQISSLTSAEDLSLFIKYISNNRDFFLNQTMHFRNQGECSWFDVACHISEIFRNKILHEDLAIIMPVPSSKFPTIAKRPQYSVLDISETLKLYNNINHWKNSVTNHILNL